MRNPLLSFIALSIMSMFCISCDNDNGTEINNYYSKPTACMMNSTFERPDTLRLLVIGNSFAQNAVDHYLDSMLNQDKYPYIIARLHFSSASLSQHVEYALNGEAPYDLLIYDSDGNRAIEHKCSLQDIIGRADWNCISFQQVSQDSGVYDTYVESLPLLIGICKDLLGHDFETILHQTWALAESFTGNKFKPYNFDQTYMYQCIVDASQRAMQDFSIDLLIPNGTAVQNARTTELYADPTFDGLHLNPLQGCYLAASTWYEGITGNDCRANSYAPEDMTSEEVRIAKEAAHAALINPYSVTQIE